MAKGRYYAKNKSMMISEDYSKTSNLPTEVVMKDYPRVDYVMQNVSDTMYGMDMQVDNAIKATRRGLAKKKY